MKERGTVLFSIDIETRGQGPASHGIISIGVCIGCSTEEKVLVKQRFDMRPLPGQVFEERCTNEFWVKHQDHLAKMTVHAKEPIAQVHAFRELLDTWDCTHEVYIVSDNPGFDFGMINYYLDMAKRPTLNYRDNKDGTLSYRNTHDADSYARAILRQDFNEPWLNNKRVIEEFKLDWIDPESHDHMPENDAELIYRLHFNATRYQVDDGPLKRPKIEAK